MIWVLSEALQLATVLLMHVWHSIQLSHTGENSSAGNNAAVWSFLGNSCRFLVKRDWKADHCRFLLDTIVLFNWCLISVNCGNSVSVKSTRTESSIMMIIRIPEFYFLLSSS